MPTLSLVEQLNHVTETVNRQKRDKQITKQTKKQTK